jgi:hypothetical protein
MSYPLPSRDTRAFLFYYDPVSGSWEPFGPKITNGGLDVNLQDQHTPIVDLYFIKDLQDVTLTTPTTLDSNIITVSADSAPNTGYVICLKNENQYYQGHIVSYSGSNPYTITMDCPLDYAYGTGAHCHESTHEMNVDASSGNIIYDISLDGMGTGVSFDITKIIFNITDKTEMDDSRFGGISGALAKGIVLRKVDGETHNIYNIKSNGDFAVRHGNLTYSDKAPAGDHGLWTYRKFGGQSENGVTIRLDAKTNDRLELILQDDLTDLYEFNCIAQGHVVE